MADVRVKCINKQPRNDTHEGITHLGGDGWKWTRQQVADSIRAKTNTFYTLVGGDPGKPWRRRRAARSVRADVRRRQVERQSSRPDRVRLT